MSIISRSATDPIRAVPIGQGTRSRSLRRGRAYGAAGCSTVPSVYSPSILCSVHQSRQRAQV